MSKKKKNIRRKKSNNLLKGMAAAGAVVGGGTIFAGNNAVYAAENEQGVVVHNQKNRLLNLNQFLNQQQNLYLKLNQKLVVLKVKHLLQLLQLKVILFKQIKKHLLNVHQASLIMNKHKVQMNKIL